LPHNRRAGELRPLRLQFLEQALIDVTAAVGRDRREKSGFGVP
jgi:hypothetical protein